MVPRTAYPTAPITVEYPLTPLGHSLGAAVDVLRTRGVKHIDEIDKARAEYERAR